MDYLDQEADVSDDHVLVPSSQQFASSEDQSRLSKRRRLNPFRDHSSDGEDDYDLPSTNIEEDNEDGFDNPRSKYETYLHIPTHVDSQRDEFHTQIAQPWSSPSAIRGPRWRKRSPTPPQPLSISRSHSAASVLQTPSISSKPSAPIHNRSNFPIVADDFDNEEAHLLEILAAEQDLEPSMVDSASIPDQSHHSHSQQQKVFRQTTLFGISTTQKPSPRATQGRTHNWRMASKNEPPTHHKINTEAMQTWVYPLNVGSIRDYQFNIVHRALFNNILVALPTGLGKTFIAATVMLNFFRWTNEAQIIFVAPTKPLVTQQVDACFHIAGIPRSQTTLLTGEIPPAIRAEEWHSRRVFFMTPQTLVNDLKTGMADPKKVVLLVVDEAHKATGNYAYVEVVRFLRRFNSSFRVLALTATPGATIEAVQKVVDGLDIARVEIRTEESMDIRAFVHSRNTELQLFDNSEEIEMCLDLFADAVKPVLTKVANLNAYYSSDPKNMTLYGLMMGRDKWAKSDAGRKADWGLKGMVNSCFKPLMSLAHNLELLKFHGIGPFYSKMKIFTDEAYSNGKYAKQIVEDDSFKKLMDRLKMWVHGEGFIGHPKLSYLNEVVLNHFMDAGNGLGAANGNPPSDTRIMVFAHYRDSAEETVRVLNRHQPMIRAHVFVGQSGTKGSEGMDQKTQIDIIKKFKTGTYNTLVATSIGEEGLDIGEVDLIVCYDCSKSPIRMLQRMGRTGRKRAGNIVLLLMRGKEERDYHAAKDNYLKMQEIIEKGTEFSFHDDQSPRIVPREIQPIVDKRIVDIPIENTQAGIPEPSKSKARNKKRPPKRFNMPDGVETGFAFLGKGGSKKSAVKKAELKSTLDTEDALLPSLVDVVLTANEETELDRRYAQVAGSQPVYVQYVRFDAHPRQIRCLSRTKLIKHSSATKALIKASQAMRSAERIWDRPSKESIITHLLESSQDVEVSLNSSQARTKPQRKPDIASVTNTSDPNSRQEDHSNDDYDENDSFIDDDPTNALDHFSSSAIESSVPRLCKVHEELPADQPFYVSQISQRNAATDDEDDLPEISAVFDKHAVKKDSKTNPAQSNAASNIPTPKKSDKRRKKARRVIEDDSDE